MKKTKQKLTLDRPATYQIKVPGELEGSWSDWDGKMTITIESDIVTANKRIQLTHNLGQRLPPAAIH